MTVTSAPNVFQMLENSMPMAPAPTTTILPGICVSSSAWREVITLSLTSTPGIMLGREPMASITFLASSISPLGSTLIFLASKKVAVPVKSSTLFLRSSPATPRVSLALTSRLLFCAAA